MRHMPKCEGKSVSQEKEYKCDGCGEGFVRNIDLKRHIKKVHPSLECNICSKVFKRKYHWIRHLKSCKRKLANFKDNSFMSTDTVKLEPPNIDEAPAYACTDPLAETSLLVENTGRGYIFSFSLHVSRFSYISLTLFLFSLVGIHNIQKL